MRPATSLYEYHNGNHLMDEGDEDCLLGARPR